MARLTVALVLAALLHAPLAQGLTIEAEQAKTKEAGKKQGDGWNLFSNGWLGDTVRIAKAGRYTVTVRAHGSPADGGWPEMALVVDGKQRAAVTVNRPDFADYTFQAELTAGTHAIGVAFTNDLLTKTEDRNLYLERIEIRAPEGAPDPTLASAKELTVEAQKLEDATVEQARKDIETHRKRDAVVQVVDADGKPVAGAAVAAELTRHAFLFGCNIYMFDRYKVAEKDAAYKRRFRELFNAATVGFYWRGYEPERGKPNYPYTDSVVAWCREHGIRLKGHPLLWANQHGQPTWAGGQPAPDIQKQRVHEIIRRYMPRIEFWEVVNEPAHLRGLKIDAPYRWAREADPKAYLIVNDYYVMANGYPPFFKLLETAIANGVPFDGIGIQAHEPRTMRFPLDSVRRILDRYATLGKELHITEFTPQSGGKAITGSHLTGEWDQAAQADYAVKFYTQCFAHPAVVALTWWDLCDHGSWQPGGGLLRKDLSPKPVYEQLHRLIHTTWHTRAAGTTDAAGRFPFRGFLGDYTLTLRRGDATVTRPLKLSGETKGDLRVSLGD